MPNWRQNRLGALQEFHVKHRGSARLLFHVKQKDVFRSTITDYIGGARKTVSDP